MSEILSSPFLGILLTVGAYQFSKWIYSKTKLTILNPILISAILCIAFLKITGISLEKYQIGGNLIYVFLGPATAVLALSIYRQLPLLKKYLIPVLAGTIAGAVVSISSVFLLCRLFKLDEVLTNSLLPKSATAPFAMDISERLGGIPSVTVAAVVLTGMIGATFAPLLIRVLRIKNPVAIGVGIGAASHAGGTSKAVEIGEIEGAMSGTAIGLTGIATVLLAMFF